MKVFFCLIIMTGVISTVSANGIIEVNKGLEVKRFKEMDKDMSGDLTFDEYSAMIRKNTIRDHADSKLTGEALKNLILNEEIRRFKTTDLNKDEKITFEEHLFFLFKEFYKAIEADKEQK